MLCGEFVSFAFVVLFDVAAKIDKKNRMRKQLSRSARFS
jgi:hypothetical protein